ncbi:MAG: hypothetical protein V4486_00220 [Patescibacteria group bacterium]
MSKRNFIILIIVLLVVILGALLAFSYLRTPTATTTTEGNNFLARFNPFKTTPAPAPAPTPSPTTPGSGDLGGGTTAAGRLKLISSVPVAGYTVFQKERLKEVPTVVPPTPAVEGATTTKTSKPVTPATEFAPALRYVDRITGNIYQTFADKIDERKFTNTVIPKVYEALFGNKGTTVIMRYLKTDDATIQTFVGILPKEFLGADTGDNTVKGTFLPDNITDLSLSPDTTKLFYLFNMGTSNEIAVGTTMDILTGKKVQVFGNNFTEWLSGWSNSKTITLTTKPSATVPGYMYNLDPNTKSFGRVFGEINGLTTLASPNGKLILYTDNTLALYLYHTDSKVSDLLGVKTMPEKCAWGAASDTIYCAVPTNATGSNYPDPWYTGEVSFTDQIWQIDVVGGTTSMILDPGQEPSGEAIDGIKLSLDDGGNYLFFVNKKDSSLWELNLK